MADAPRGAAAPIPSADLAESTTNLQRTHGPAPEPHALLQHLAGWLSACQYADDRPWQMAIAATLAEHPPGAAVEAERPQPIRNIDDHMRFELHPVLAGLSLMTNTVRVLRDLSDYASASKSFDAAMADACPTWLDPLAFGGEKSAEAVIADLARYADSLCTELLVSELIGGAA